MYSHHHLRQLGPVLLAVTAAHFRSNVSVCVSVSVSDSNSVCASVSFSSSFSFREYCMRCIQGMYAYTLFPKNGSLVKSVLHTTHLFPFCLHRYAATSPGQQLVCTILTMTRKASAEVLSTAPEILTVRGKVSAQGLLKQ